MTHPHDPLGYGAYNYNVEDYGDARSQSGLPLDSGHFSFDNWGEHLNFCFSGDGKIYQWRPNSAGGYSRYYRQWLYPTRLQACQAIIVTNERHLVAIGSGGDPRKIAMV